MKLQYSFKYYSAKIQARIQEFVLQGASSCIGEGSGDRLSPQRVLGSAGGGVPECLGNSEFEEFM